METVEITIETGAQLVSDLTDHLERFCIDHGDGLVNVFVPHATAGIGLMETGSGSEHDLAQAIDRLLPPDHPYVHRHGAPGHGRDHVLPCFIGTSTTIPMIAGRPLIGTWQRLVLIDSNVDNTIRHLRFTFLPG